MRLYINTHWLIYLLYVTQTTGIDITWPEVPHYANLIPSHETLNVSFQVKTICSTYLHMISCVRSTLCMSGFLSCPSYIIAWREKWQKYNARKIYKSYKYIHKHIRKAEQFCYAIFWHIKSYLSIHRAKGVIF